MNPLVFIPARGGSKRIPHKNLTEFRGKPLLLWAIEHSLRHGITPLVTTDDSQIADYALRCRARVIPQSEESAGDNVSYFPVLADHAAKTKSHLIFLECTSPLYPPDLLPRAIELLEAHNAVYSGCRLPVQWVFDRFGLCVNREPTISGVLPVTQAIEDDPHYIPTGHLFGLRYPHYTDRPGFYWNRHYGCRKPGIVEVPWTSALDIDYPDQLQPPSVCVVGNSGSLLGKRLGHLINNHDVVIRCNSARFYPLTRDTGRKFTHWAASACIALARQLTPETSNCEDLVEVWLRQGTIRPDDNIDEARETIQRLVLTVSSRLSNVKTQRAISGNYQSLVPGITSPVNPSTGMLAILKAIDRWKVPVTVVGFGHRSEVMPGYYYGGPWWREEEIAHPYGHKPDEERLLINKLEDKGLVRRLDG